MKTKTLIVLAKCRADVDESWIYTVPDGWDPAVHDMNDILDHPEKYGARFETVINEVDNEEDREIVEWQLEDSDDGMAPIVPPTTRTFRVVFKQDEFRECVIDAPDMDTARKIFYECGFDNSEFVDAENTVISRITELEATDG